MRRQATSFAQTLQGSAPPSHRSSNVCKPERNQIPPAHTPSDTFASETATGNLQFGKEALRGRTGDEQMPEQIRHHRDADDDVARSDVTTLSVVEVRASNCDGTVGCKSDELAIAVISNYNSDKS